MMKSISNVMSVCRYIGITMMATLLLTACEKAVEKQFSGEGNVTLRFQPNSRDVTRANAVSNYFTKLNVQIFDAQGEKVFEKVKTQTSDDDDFGTLSLKLTAGTYTVVAVGHSSKNSATIKSPTDVRFTASDGEKLTDTFCHCSQITVADEKADFTLEMNRVAAMVQFCLEDDDVPASFAFFKIEYTGGSANFNPTTFEGITKSSQSENRIRNSLNIHQCYTFPYMATTGKLKMTCSATDADGTIIRQRTFTDVPVSRNRITTYTGPFFGEGDGVFTQSDFSFVIHADWDGIDYYEF